MATPEPSRTPELESPSQGAGRIRLLIVGLIAIVLLAFVLASTYSRSFQSCTREPATSGNRTVEVCRPVATSDAPVVIGIVLIVLLLLPDFSEVAVPGLVSLRRRVDQQGQRQDRLEERLQVAISQKATAQVNQVMPVLATPEMFEQFSKGVP
jgi:hypothetical protein